MVLSDLEEKKLVRKAYEVRRTIIEMLAESGVKTKSGHTAGPMGMADIFTALYFNVMKHDPKKWDWDERDRLFLSNGHITPVRYAVMAHAGYFPIEECLTLRQFGSRMQGHPERDILPCVESTSGPLGSGLSQAAGYAYAGRMDGKKFRVFCATSDGEHQEGNTWEGAMFAGKYRLNNLVQIMDRNNIQIEGDTEKVMPLEPLADKYRAFNWHVIDIDGHNIRQFVDACNEAAAIQEKPTLILANTIPGKGVKEMENDYKWHGKPPTKEEAAKFLAELDATMAEVEKTYA